MVVLQVFKEKLGDPEKGDLSHEACKEEQVGLLLKMLGLFSGVAAFLAMILSAFISCLVATALLFPTWFDFSVRPTVLISGLMNLIMTYLSYGLFWIIHRSGAVSGSPRFWSFIPNPKFLLIWLYSGLVNLAYHLGTFYLSPATSYQTEFTTFLAVYYVILFTVNVYLAVLLCQRPTNFQK